MKRWATLWPVAVVVLAVLLAVAASVVLAMSDDLDWVRLAGLGGLWVALLAWLLADHSRRLVHAAEQRELSNRRTYEFELLREVVARREFEERVAAELRDTADDALRDDLAALREQLDRLTVPGNGTRPTAPTAAAGPAIALPVDRHESDLHPVPPGAKWRVFRFGQHDQPRRPGVSGPSPAGEHGRHRPG